MSLALALSIPMFGIRKIRYEYVQLQRSSLVWKDTKSSPPAGSPLDTSSTNGEPPPASDPYANRIMTLRRFFLGDPWNLLQLFAAVFSTLAAVLFLLMNSSAVPTAAVASFAMWLEVRLVACLSCFCLV